MDKTKTLIEEFLHENTADFETIKRLKNSMREIFLIKKNGNFCHNTDKIIVKLTGKK